MIAYVCGVSFQHEIGECSDIPYYDTLEELKAKGKCWEECGAVELEFDGPYYPRDRTEIKSHEWVVRQTMFDKSWTAKKEEEGKNDA